jgi:hypothetical protein
LRAGSRAWSGGLFAAERSHYIGRPDHEADIASICAIGLFIFPILIARSKAVLRTRKDIPCRRRATIFWLISWRTHPYVALFLVFQGHGHRIGMYRLDVRQRCKSKTMHVRPGGPCDSPWFATLMRSNQQSRSLSVLKSARSGPLRRQTYFSLQQIMDFDRARRCQHRNFEMISLYDVGNVARAVRDNVDTGPAPQAVIEQSRAA